MSQISKRILFHGTMNASKSAQILMQTFNFSRQGKTFVIFKPDTDTRDEGYIKSRALSEVRPAFTIRKDCDGLMFSIVKSYLPNFIFVDEIQFFSKEQIEELSKISIELGVPIFAYGLLISYTGELFEGSKRAIECGFSLNELKMQCDSCDSKSTHHLLYIDGKVSFDGNGIHVGNEEYKSVCYPCYSQVVSNYKSDK